MNEAATASDYAYTSSNGGDADASVVLHSSEVIDDELPDLRPLSPEESYTDGGIQDVVDIPDAQPRQYWIWNTHVHEEPESVCTCHRNAHDDSSDTDEGPPPLEDAVPTIHSGPNGHEDVLLPGEIETMDRGFVVHVREHQFHLTEGFQRALRQHGRASQLLSACAVEWHR